MYTPGRWGHDMPSAHQYNTGEFVPPQHGTTRRSSYTSIKLVGNHNMLGTTNGGGADFVKIDIHGHRNLVGDHEPILVGDFLKRKAHTCQKWTCGCQSRRGVSSSRSSMKKTSAKRAARKAAFRSGTTNKKDYDKMDYES